VPPAASAGAGLAVTVAAWLAWRAHALTARGAVAAWVVGTLVIWGAGWAGGLVLLAFFAPTTLLGRVVRGRTAESADPKGDCRDEWQVLANGGAAALGAIVAHGEPPLGLWLVTGALAAAGADTWATIWGARSPTPPRHLLSGRPVPHGTSGGVSPLGSLGAVAGAGVVALTGAAAGGGAALAAAGTIAGVAGMVADSALGASLQGRFHCPACGIASERTVHRCGTGTLHTGGLPWLTNDGVNALATITGAAIVLGASLWG
jgi:uncharacterized protein (TIGR00297 family)